MAPSDEGAVSKADWGENTVDPFSPSGPPGHLPHQREAYISKGGPSLKYLKQFLLIILFSFLGELCRYLIPYPIPGSIYGMVLMFGALSLKIVKIENIREGGYFLTSCLPILFVAPVVNLMDCWDQIKANWLAMVLIVLVSTFVTFGVSGMVTQWVINRRKAGGDHV